MFKNANDDASEAFVADEYAFEMDDKILPFDDDSVAPSDARSMI